MDCGRLGPMIETDPLFPERVNVNFAQVIGENHIRLIVWERGAGLTQACGTGACATAVAAIRRKLMTGRSEEHTSELQSLMRISYAVFCLKKKKNSAYSNRYYACYIHHTHNKHSKSMTLHQARTIQH